MQLVMTNTEKSEVVIARILTTLSDRGIRDGDLEFRDFGLDEEFADFFFPCLSWLEREGLVSFEQVARLLGSPTITGAAVLTPCLTSHGYSQLGRTMTIAGNKQTMAEAVSKVSKDGRSSSVVGDFVGGLLGGFTKSMGGSLPSMPASLRPSSFVTPGAPRC